LTDASGATVIFEGVPSLDKEFRQEGFRAGTCWSECDEGTNGVGTTIMDRAPTLVHKTEHFRAHNISFTCSAAPIFGPDEELLAVLDASALPKLGFLAFWRANNPMACFSPAISGNA
jgi:transcriptional regulator of acetoin/glycerol metabolism